MKTSTLSLSNFGEAIYIISDLHSNLPALEAVLRLIPENSLTVCAGDVVGYYLEPNEVCSLLQSRSVLCVKGNHDKYVLGELEYPVNREVKYRISLTRETLTDVNLKWLTELPDCIFIEFDCDLENSSLAPSMQITHGSPRSIEEYIYPDTPINFITEKSSTYTVLGHTHHPMIRKKDGRLIINPGSVGQARDRVPGASYASINPISGTVSFYRVMYQISAYQNRLRNADVDEAMIKILSRESTCT